MSIREDAQNAALVRATMGIDINELEQEIAKLRRENESLKKTISSLRSDAAWVEQSKRGGTM